MAANNVNVSVEDGSIVIRIATDDAARAAASQSGRGNLILASSGGGKSGWLTFDGADKTYSLNLALIEKQKKGK